MCGEETNQKAMRYAAPNSENKHENHEERWQKEEADDRVEWRTLAQALCNRTLMNECEERDFYTSLKNKR